MAYTNAWDETAPLGTAYVSTVDDVIRQLKLDLRERLASSSSNFNTGNFSFGGTLAIAGNVGIGGATPATRFHLLNDSVSLSANNFLTVQNRGTNAVDNSNSYPIGGLLFAGFRDVRDPSYAAGIWGYRTPYASGLTSAISLVFGAMNQGGNFVGDVGNELPTERMRITAEGMVCVGTTFTGGASGGDVIFTNERGVRGVNVAGTATYGLVRLNSSDVIVLGDSSRDVAVLGLSISSGSNVISTGAPDSAGTGYKFLRVPN